MIPIGIASTAASARLIPHPRTVIPSAVQNALVWTMSHSACRVVLAAGRSRCEIVPVREISSHRANAASTESTGTAIEPARASARRPGVGASSRAGAVLTPGVLAAAGLPYKHATPIGVGTDVAAPPTGAEWRYGTKCRGRERGGRPDRLPDERGDRDLPDHPGLDDGRARRRLGRRGRAEPLGLGPGGGRDAERGRSRGRAPRRAPDRRAGDDVHGVAGPAADDPRHVQDRRGADARRSSTSPPARWRRTRSRSSATTPT